MEPTVPGFYKERAYFTIFAPPPLSSDSFGFFENFLFHAPARIPFPEVALPRDREGGVVPVRTG